jgi:AcrR family transcriptional regulator
MQNSVRTVTKPKATRQAILNAALELFREQGFESATMRQIAGNARVALGAAYYYFDSKDAIVLAFYEQSQHEMTPRLEIVLASTRDLRERLRELIAVKLDYFAPSRRLLGALSGHTNPESPLSPFGDRTRSIRDQDMAWFDKALEGCQIGVPEDLRRHLPRLLWMFQMGIILFWINDRSTGQKKSRLLLDKSLDMVVRLIKLASLPLTKPLRRTAIELVDLMMEDDL